jgi:hypothetical protein
MEPPGGSSIRVDADVGCVFPATSGLTVRQLTRRPGAAWSADW